MSTPRQDRSGRNALVARRFQVVWSELPAKQVIIDSGARALLQYLKRVAGPNAQRPHRQAEAP